MKKKKRKKKKSCLKVSKSFSKTVNKLSKFVKK
jgi:hypothetical protein